MSDPIDLEEMAPPEVIEAWDREIARRITAHQAGETEAYDLEDVLSQAHDLSEWTADPGY
jgi:hypothetical protein